MTAILELQKGPHIVSTIEALHLLVLIGSHNFNPACKLVTLTSAYLPQCNMIL